MQDDSMWSKFTQTGDIEYYLIYKAESEEEIKQCTDTKKNQE